MIENQFYINRIYFLVSFTICSSFCFSQDCNSLSINEITNPGEYNVGSLTESDGIRNGPGYAGATIYYPTDATPPFTSIVIVPGYVSPQSSIQSWGPFLASHGIVTMTIGTNNFFDFPIDRKNALLDAINTLSEENIRADSPLIGELDIERVAVGGWSMGGGGAQLAAAADTTIKAVVALCPWLETSQLAPADLDHPVPLLIFTGEQDGIAPPASHAYVHYDYTPESTNKLLFEIDNAGHSVANDPIGGEEYVGKIALSWLQQYLIGDSCYCPLVLDAPPIASSYMTNVVCSVITTATSEIGVESNFSCQLYPNPSIERINIEIQDIGQGTTYEILSLTGDRFSKGIVANKITTIDIQSLPSGVYIMNVIFSYFSERLKFVVI